MFLANEFVIFLLIISTISFIIILMQYTKLHNFSSFSAVDNLGVNQALMDLREFEKICFYYMHFSSLLFFTHLPNINIFHSF